jgi:uncharacterized protein YjbJ (UPF0337 family)
LESAARFRDARGIASGCRSHCSSVRRARDASEIASRAAYARAYERGHNEKPRKYERHVDCTVPHQESEDDIMGELIDKAKGKIKQAVGDATGDQNLKGEGVIDEAKGKVKGAFEEVKQAAKDVIQPKQKQNPT